MASGSMSIRNRSMIRLDSATLLARRIAASRAWHGRIAGEGSESLQRRRVVQHRSPSVSTNSAGEAGIGLEQPAAERDAVGFVNDPIRIQRVHIVKHGGSHQVRVQFRHAVDTMRAEKCQRTHANLTPAVLVDQRH